MKQNTQYVYQRGQALLTLLVFMIIVITITTGAIIVILVNSNATTKYTQSDRAYTVAESGEENAILQLIRNTSYPGEVLTIDDGTAAVQVTGTNPYTITSQGKIGSFLRTIQVVVQYTNNMFTVTSWKEI